MSAARRVRTGPISRDRIVIPKNRRDPFTPGFYVGQRPGHYRIPLLIPGAPTLFVEPGRAWLMGKRTDVEL